MLQMLRSSGKKYSRGNLYNQLTVRLPKGTECQVEWDARSTVTGTVTAVDVSLIRYPCISVTRGARVEGFVEVRLGVKKGKVDEYLRLRETNPGLSPLPQTTAIAIAKAAKIQTKKSKRRCTVAGCSKSAVQGGLCIGHGAKRKPRKRCEVENCTNFSVQGGRCIKHGAKRKRCSVDDCEKHTHRGGMCKKHFDHAQLFKIPKVLRAQSAQKRVTIKKRTNIERLAFGRMNE